MTRRMERKVQAGLQVRPGTHVAQLYGSPAALGGAIGFAAEALSRGEACAVLAYSRFNERAAAQLRDLHSVDLKRAQADSRLSFLEGRSSAREMRADLLRFVEKARRARRAVRVVTSLGWGEEGWPDDDDLLQLEADLGGLAREHDLAVLCLYDVRQLAGALIMDGALGCHPLVHHREQAVKNPFVLPPAALQRELAARKRSETGLRAWMQ